MVRVPTWEPEISNLPGASNLPHATPDSFGAQIGVAQEKAGKSIMAAGLALGNALSDQADQQNAIAAKTEVSNHEVAVNMENLRLQQTTPAAEAYSIPDKVNEFARNDWANRQGNVGGRYNGIATSNVNSFWNRLYLQNQAQAVKSYHQAVGTQIGNAVDQRAALVFADPNQRTAAASAIREMVVEAKVPDDLKRQMLTEAGSKLVTQIYAGYDQRALEAYNRGDYDTGNGILATKQELTKTLPAEMARTLGMESLQKPVAPTILQPGTRIMPGSSLNQRRISAMDATPYGAMIDAEAAKYTNISPAAAKVIAHVESGGRADAVTGSYQGLFQLSAQEMKQFNPLGNRMNAKDNIAAGVASLSHKATAFERDFGRPPSVVELYMMHQQGEAGAKAHIARPDRAAWENMAATGEGRQKGAAWAKKAIWGNVPDDMKKLFPGGVDSVTAEAFMRIWAMKLAGGKHSLVAEDNQGYF